MTSLCNFAAIEEEVKFSAYHRGQRVNQEVALRRLSLALAREARHDGAVVNASHRLWLSNGGAYYHCGSYPELNTPEYSDPREAVAGVLAGRQLITRAVAQLGEYDEVVLGFGSSVDYRTLSTKGFHLNLGPIAPRNNDLRAEENTLRTILAALPLLVGPGGLDPSHPGIALGPIPKP